MVHDFGPGMSVDELIGMPAWHIHRLVLPHGESFVAANKAARLLVEAGIESCALVELWEDGHSVWSDLKTNQPVVVSPTGQILRSQT